MSSYAHAAQKLRASRVLVVLDLDRTMALSVKDSSNESLHAVFRNDIRKTLKELGAVVVFTTARTPELVMSSPVYWRSVRSGFNRPPTLQLIDNNGLRGHVPLEELAAFEGILDPDIISSFGTGIYVWRDHTFFGDAGFNARPGAWWREEMMRRLKEADTGGDLLSHLDIIEFEENYRERLADVMPHPYRIQFNFRGHRAEEKKLAAEAKVRELLRGLPRGCSAHVVDESRPRENKYCFYVLARGKTKNAALDHIVLRLCNAARIRPSSLNIFVAGDSLTDLESAVAGPDCNFWYCLPSDSPISQLVFGDHSAQFAGHGLNPRFITARDAGGFDPNKKRLTLRLPGHENDRPFIVSDREFPGQFPASSVALRLEAFRLSLGR